MLFNSYEFIFVFLPLTLAGYLLLSRYAGTAAVVGFIFAASLVFYAYWSLPYLGLLLLSITVNFWLSRYLIHGNDIQRRRILIAGVVFNLSLLAYFKYTGFIASNIASLSGVTLHLPQIILPIGISFYTFTQTAYLVDCYRARRVERNFLSYGLFVTVFPHLIAGPIIHHSEMLPQFRMMNRLDRLWSNFSSGLTFFCIGLFKKVMLADSIAIYASPIFSAADNGLAVSTFEAWGGALAYTLQIYFDFSGYCDMAIGLGLMLGIKLPINFNSPYKSASIIEFWRRWHMTLSRFLRDYLYIALGGNRHGHWRKHTNLMITMLLGGLWHGASWTFVIWGGLHGAYLILAHFLGTAWSRALNTVLQSRSTRRVNMGLTMLAVVVGWVFFRAGSFSGAWHLITAMFCIDGCSLPSTVADISMLRGALQRIGTQVDQDSILSLGAWMQAWPLIIALFLATQLLPNTQEITGYSGPRFDGNADQHQKSPTIFIWKPSRKWAIALGLMATLCILNLASVTEFLYFQF